MSSLYIFFPLAGWKCLSIPTHDSPDITTGDTGASRYATPLCLFCSVVARHRFGISSPLAACFATIDADHTAG